MTYLLTCIIPQEIRQNTSKGKSTSLNSRQSKENQPYVYDCLLCLALLCVKSLDKKYILLSLVVLLTRGQTTLKSVSKVKTIVNYHREALSKHSVLNFPTKMDLQLLLNSILNRIQTTGNDFGLIGLKQNETEWPFKKKLPPDKPDENEFCLRSLVGSVTFRNIKTDPIVIAPGSLHTVVNQLSNDPVDESMKYEMLRFRSFEQYKTENKPFRIRFAQAGFYYSGKGDEVICYCCKHSKGNWSANDDPYQIHKTMCPSCPFLTNNTGVNIPVAPGEGAGASYIASSSVLGAASAEIVSQNTKGNSKQPNGEINNNTSLPQTKQHSSAHSEVHEQSVFQYFPVAIDQRHEENYPILRNSASGDSPAKVANSGNLAFTELTTGCSQQKGK